MSEKEIENRFSRTDPNIQSELAGIPSRGKVYPKESSLHNKTSIAIKIMSAEEEDILNNRAYLKQGIALDRLLSAVILDKTAKLDEMIVGDKNAILLYTRIIGYGSEYKVDNLKCENCDKNFKATVNLGTIKIRELDDETNPIETGINRFEFVLPRLNKKVYFHLLTNKDEAEISKIEDNKKRSGAVQPAPITTQLFHQIDEIEGVEEKDKMKFIKKMSAFDSKELRNRIESITPGPIMRQELTCPHCDDTREYIVPIGTGFFWPR